MILHIPHSSELIPSYEDEMAKDKEVLNAIERYTDFKTNELFSFEKATKVEYAYSRLFCDVEKLEKNEPMEKLGLGILYDVSKKSRKYPNRALETYTKHHKKLLEVTSLELDLFDRAIIIDCHSFSAEQAKEQGFNEDLPNICLGVDEIHTSDVLVSLCKEHFNKDGYSIGVNVPFCGTIIPLTLYGNENILSIMIEINKESYDSDEKFLALKRSIGTLLEKIHTLYN